MSRVLEEKCPECGWPTREEKAEYKGEELAICYCLNPRCDWFNWQLPEDLDLDSKEFDTPEYWERFEKCQEWACEQAEQMKSAFLSQRPIVLRIPIAEADVDRWLEKLTLSPGTYQQYRRLLLRFLNWLREQYEERGKACPNCGTHLVMLEKPINPLHALSEEITDYLIDREWKTETVITAVCPRCGYFTAKEVRPDV